MGGVGWEQNGWGGVLRYVPSSEGMLLTPSSDKTLAVLQLSAVSLSSSLPGRESSPAFGLKPFPVRK